MLTEFASFTLADYALGWLAIITAKKVEPVWCRIGEQSPPDSFLVPKASEILQLAEKVLNHEVDFLQASDLLVNAYWFFQHDSVVTFEVACAYQAAAFALHLIIFGARDLNSQENYDEGLGVGFYDFATVALKAYSALDLNPPSAVYRHFAPLTFDVQKRLEFWEWWLVEAIPQAWELAENYNSAVS